MKQNKVAKPTQNLLIAYFHVDSKRSFALFLYIHLRDTTSSKYIYAYLAIKTAGTTHTMNVEITIIHIMRPTLTSSSKTAGAFIKAYVQKMQIPAKRSITNIDNKDDPSEIPINNKVRSQKLKRQYHIVPMASSLALAERIIAETPNKIKEQTMYTDVRFEISQVLNI